MRGHCAPDLGETLARTTVWSVACQPRGGHDRSVSDRSPSGLLGVFHQPPRLSVVLPLLAQHRNSRRHVRWRDLSHVPRRTNPPRGSGVRPLHGKRTLPFHSMGLLACPIEHALLSPSLPLPVSYFDAVR